MDAEQLENLIAFQNEFIARYVARFKEQPEVDILIRDALVELKELKEKRE